jgi:hypothetical protein
LQSESVKKLEAFANENKQTQGKFTIGDEKVCCDGADFMATTADFHDRSTTFS